MARGPGGARHDRVPVAKALDAEHNRVLPGRARIDTSAPGITPMFTTRPGPPNHVSVHPPMSQIRTGADASIAPSSIDKRLRVWTAIARA